MTTTNTATKFHKMGITGINLDRRALGRISRSEWIALTTAHAAKITAELPDGLMVNRYGEMFQRDGGTVGFHEFADMIYAAHRKVS